MCTCVFYSITNWSNHHQIHIKVNENDGLYETTAIKQKKIIKNPNVDLGGIV